MVKWEVLKSGSILTTSIPNGNWRELPEFGLPEIRGSSFNATEQPHNCLSTSVSLARSPPHNSFLLSSLQEGGSRPSLESRGKLRVPNMHTNFPKYQYVPDDKVQGKNQLR